MNRRDRQRLEDVEVAVQTIRAHLQRGDLHDGLIFDAVRVRLIEIGEAVKGLSAELLASEPAIPWTEIARMRDRLAHRYFDTSHAVVQATVDHDLPQLDSAIARLVQRTQDT
ncbi:MAG TPA: HepT-like ribonuclease domain-containing protein [Dermatophilaceae bacterium]|nr:HepT-like ribonuclease domain-containing protein [Dermatophilaceae bacterium]